MKIYVHVREKTIAVSCGEGTQKVRWLAAVAMTRYDHQNGLELGQATAVKTEDETALDMDMPLNEQLSDNQHVYLGLEDDWKSMSRTSSSGLAFSASLKSLS